MSHQNDDLGNDEVESKHTKELNQISSDLQAKVSPRTRPSRLSSAIGGGLIATLAVVAVQWVYPHASSWITQLAREKPTIASVIAESTDSSSELHRSPSLDCKDPVTIGDVFICANPPVLKLHNLLNDRYNAHLLLLPRELQERVIDGQSAWDKYWPTACSSDPHKLVLAKDSLECVVERFEARITQLSVDAIRLGELVTSEAVKVPSNLLKRVYVSYVDSVLSADPDDQSVTRLEVTYPQLFLEPNLAGEMKSVVSPINHWLEPNDLMNLIKLEPGEDFDFSRAVAAVTPELLRATDTITHFPHGAAHEVRTVSAGYFLVRQLRSMQSQDFFSGKQWIESAGKYVHEELTRLGNDELIEKHSDLIDFMSSVDRWFIDKDGLTFWFNVYEVAPYAAGPQSITVPWRLLAGDLTDFGRRQVKKLRGDQ